ncbi:MAG: hypothetical protein SGI98_10975 [Verrucomicrobiota bacterium]|nr:hypothetical protein [Verrucomicrobiota bacterium]
MIPDIPLPAFVKAGSHEYGLPLCDERHESTGLRNDPQAEI